MKAISQSASFSLEKDEKIAATALINIIVCVSMYFFAKSGDLQQSLVALAISVAMGGYVAFEMNTIEKIKKKMSSASFRYVGGFNLAFLFLLTF